jgi:eukaryotic-like serine/threonine-protein kinase
MRSTLKLAPDPKLLDPKTGIYSLGAVWFTMLCGQPPAGVKVETMLRATPSISDSLADLALQRLATSADRLTAGDLIH